MPEDGSIIEEDNHGKSGFFSSFFRWFSKGESTQVQQVNGTHLGSPSPTPSEMRLRVSEFETARVSDVMIPRVEIKAVEIDTNVEDLLKIFSEDAHSRLPVYREALDDPVGFVHIKDVVAEIAANEGVENIAGEKLLSRLKREILFVPASMRLPDLLVKMQSTRIHLALVVDEYGGTDGLVSLEDLVEQIVGDIEDEHDEDEALFTKRAPGVWEADARTEIAEFEVEAEQALALSDNEAEIDTLGGLVFALAGHVPQRGEIVQHPEGVVFEVLEADPRRIKKLRVRCGTTHYTANNSNSNINPEAKAKAVAEEA